MTAPGAGAPAPSPLRGVMQLVTPGARARKNKQLLLYVHVPFCSSKCHFCDWVVGYRTADLVDTGDLRERYVDALCRQIESYGPRLRDLSYTVTNIYWGGGTPTRLEPRHLARIHATLDRAFDLSSVVEHTAECSPETITAGHLDALRGAGLNRISVGVQSFDDRVLRRMGRAHDAAGATQAIELIRGHGVENVNIDLIAGFPGQDEASLDDSIDRAIAMGVPHLSLYMFRESSPDLVAIGPHGASPRDATARTSHTAQFVSAKRRLERAGYDEYIVGYFARAPQYRFDGEDYYFSLRGDYFGFGAGAASTLGRCSLKSGQAARYGNAHVRAYIDDPTQMVAAPLAMMPDDIYLASYFKAFATRGGIRFSRWLDQFGFDFPAFRASRRPIAEWFAERERAGARFIENARGISLSSETWVETMIWRQ